MPPCSTRQLRRFGCCIGPGTQGPCQDPPVWSPDGRRLAFVVDEYDRRATYTVRSDGLDWSRGLESPSSWSAVPMAAPTWSPDSERVAFAAFNSEEAIVYVRYDGAKRIWSSGPDNSRINQTGVLPPTSEILFVYSDINVYSAAQVVTTAYMSGPDGSGLRCLDFRGSYTWPPGRRTTPSSTPELWPQVSHGVQGRHRPASLARNDEPWLAQSPSPKPPRNRSLLRLHLHPGSVKSRPRRRSRGHTWVLPTRFLNIAGWSIER